LADPAFFPGRAATIYYRAPSGQKEKMSTMEEIKNLISSKKPVDTPIGTLGVLHPSVLEKFEIGYPCSAVEFTLEPFKKEMHDVWTTEGVEGGGAYIS
jgi:phenylalanyl-tRNA synthetase beta chain